MHVNLKHQHLEYVHIQSSIQYDVLIISTSNPYLRIAPVSESSDTYPTIFIIPQFALILSDQVNIKIFTLQPQWRTPTSVCFLLYYYYAITRDLQKQFSLLCKQVLSCTKLIGEGQHCIHPYLQ